MTTLDRQVLPGAQGYGVGRGQLGQYHQTQQGEKRRGDAAGGIGHYLWENRKGCQWNGSVQDGMVDG